MEGEKTKSEQTGGKWSKQRKQRQKQRKKILSVGGLRKAAAAAAAAAVVCSVSGEAELTGNACGLFTVYLCRITVTTLGM